MVFYYREGHESDEAIQMSSGSLFDDAEQNCKMVEDDVFSKYTFTINCQVICYDHMSYMSTCMLSFVCLKELFTERFKT